MAFFLLVSLISLGITYYDSNEFWYKGEQVKLGLWFDDYDEGFSTVLFDKRDGGGISKYDQKNIFGGDGTYTVIGFWMNDNIVIENVKKTEGINYIVSRHILNYPVLYETENGIFLYQILS